MAFEVEVARGLASSGRWPIIRVRLPLVPYKEEWKPMRVYIRAALLCSVFAFLIGCSSSEESPVVSAPKVASVEKPAAPEAPIIEENPDSPSGLLKKWLEDINELSGAIETDKGEAKVREWIGKCNTTLKKLGEVTIPKEEEKAFWDKFAGEGDKAIVRLAKALDRNEKKYSFVRSELQAEPKKTP